MGVKKNDAKARLLHMKKGIESWAVLSMDEAKSWLEHHGSVGNLRRVLIAGGGLFVVGSSRHAGIAQFKCIEHGQFKTVLCTVASQGEINECHKMRRCRPFWGNISSLRVTRVSK